MAKSSEEQILRAAEKKTARAYQESPTGANLRDWNSAKTALAQYLSVQSDAAGAERFKNIEQAAAWVTAEGYLVNPRTVRNHADKPGFPKRQKDGGYLKAEIETYAKATWENPSRGGEEKSAAPVDHKARFLKEQADKLALQNEITRRNYLLRTEVEQRCAAAASFLKTDLANFGPRVCDAMVQTVAGYLRGQGVDIEDLNLQAVVPDLLEEYDRKLDSWLDRYARETTFTAGEA